MRRRAEIAQLEAWNATARAYPEGACLHHLVEAQARRTPAAIAVVDGERRLTYAELNARANQLAHHLRELGVGPEARVGLCLHRSAEMVIGLLATLKAGGCYVPLDPELPAARLRELLHDSAPRVVLVDDAGAPAIARAGAGHRGAALHVTAGADRWARAPAEDTAPAALSDQNLAYEIFTSGSTGRPKGVMNEHRGVINGLRWCVEALAGTARDGVRQ
jgi:non-ribosomal peptide synthetase component F